MERERSLYIAAAYDLVWVAAFATALASILWS